MGGAGQAGPESGAGARKVGGAGKAPIASGVSPAAATTSCVAQLGSAKGQQQPKPAVTTPGDRQAQDQAATAADRTGRGPKDRRWSRSTGGHSRTSAGVKGGGSKGSAIAEAAEGEEGCAAAAKNKTPPAPGSTTSASGRSKSAMHKETSHGASVTPTAPPGPGHRGRRGTGVNPRRTNSPASAPPQRLPPLVPTSDEKSPAAATAQGVATSQHSRSRSYSRVSRRPADGVNRTETRSRPSSGGSRSSSGGRRPGPSSSSGNAGSGGAGGGGGGGGGSMKSSGTSSSVPQLPRIVQRRNT